MKTTKHDAMMFGLYLIVIAMGAVIFHIQPILGIAQIIVGALFFGLRLHHLAK